jgi:uncharacterized protein
MMKTVDEWKALFRARIRAALGARDKTALTVLRETLAAIENAEAPPAGHAPTLVDAPSLGSVGTLGAGEAPRLVLPPEAVVALIERELRELRDAVAEYLRVGRPDEADVLSLQAEVLADLVAEASKHVAEEPK